MILETNVGGGPGAEIKDQKVVRKVSVAAYTERTFGFCIDDDGRRFKILVEKRYDKLTLSCEKL